MCLTFSFRLKWNNFNLMKIPKNDTKWKIHS